MTFDLGEEFLEAFSPGLPNVVDGARMLVFQAAAEMDGRIVDMVQYGMKGSRLHVAGLMVGPEFHRLGVDRSMADSRWGGCRSGQSGISASGLVGVPML